ncbi:hypothetical protein OJ998_09245 [Solirubrobacter taibaiensis]|nr:hypothetical protein [Solirubrobacter taibaiensis]
MRVALAGLIFFALAVPARADTWVPDDPADPDVLAEVSAPDGTAATSSKVEEFGPLYVRVRLPGRTWGEEVAIGDSVGAADVAVAPSGWVAVAWSDDGLEETHVAVLHPDGRRTEQRLERSRSEEVTVAIDARGTATAAWQSGDGMRATDGFSTPEAENFDVTVSPGGRRLLSWEASAGVLARVDGEPPQLVAPDAGVTEIESEIGEDGAALIAYRDLVSHGVAVVDRAAGGAWMPPHGVTAGRTSEPLSRTEPNGVSTVLAVDGRAAVVWSSPGWNSRVWAVAGRAGGAWDPPTPLSFPLRFASPAEATVDAAGNPRVLWAEQAGPRGAKAVVDAVPDTTALGAELTLPPRLPATDDGSLTIVARARCAKACEVGVRSGNRIAARTLRAGETTTFRLKAGDIRLLYPRNRRRVQVELGAADRSGHDRVVKRTFTVRVIRRPIRSFKVGPSHDFVMGSRAGNRAVGRLVNALLEGLASGDIRTERELIRRYQAGARIVDDFDGGIDTAVGDEIFAVVIVPFALKGFSAESVLGS